MNGHGGFICLWRSLLGHPAFRNEGEAMQFAWMILRAAWKPTRVRYKGKAIHLQRGQLAVSVRDMARALERPAPAIQRFLNRLKNDTMIDTRADTGVTIVTICNYALFQDKPDLVDTAGETAGETVPIQGRYTEQQSKQIKQDSLPQEDKSRSFIPEDWKPPPIEGLPPKAKESARQWPRGAYEREAEDFVLYWRSERKTKADWPATWANRILRAHWRVMQEARRRAGSRTGNGDEKKMYQLLAEERAGRA